MAKTFINIKFPEEWLYNRKLLTDPEILQWINELLERNVYFSSFQPLNQHNGVTGIIALVDKQTIKCVEGYSDDTDNYPSEFIFETFDKNPDHPGPKGDCVEAGNIDIADNDDRSGFSIDNSIVIEFKNKEDYEKALQTGKAEFPPC